MRAVNARASVVLNPRARRAKGASMSLVRSGRFVVFAVGALALTACATPVVYGPMAANGFGYSDMQNADGSYTIRTVTLTSVQAHEFWDRRAAELCGGPNFTKNIFRAEIPVVTTTGYAAGPNGYGASYTQDAYGALIMEGYARCRASADAGAAAPANAAASAEPVSAETAPAPQP